MMRNLKDSIRAEFMHVVAERVFKEHITAFVTEVTPAYLEYWAKNDISVEEIMQLMGKPIPQRSTGDGVHPGVAYLMSLPKERLLVLIEQAAPRHAAILRKYPEYADSLLTTLPKLLGVAM